MLPHGEEESYAIMLGCPERLMDPDELLNVPSNMAGNSVDALAPWGIKWCTGQLM